MWNKLYDRNRLILWVDISTLCNAKCPQCHRTDTNGLNTVSWLPKYLWTLDEFKNVYDPETLRHCSEVQICGTWGEPVTNPDLYDIIEYIVKNSNCYIILNTNGSLKSEEWWFSLGELTRDGRMEVHFAVEGITQEMHSKYRRNTKLKKILENINAYSIYGISHGFIVIFKHNKDYIGQIKELLYTVGCTYIRAIPSNRFHSEKYEFTNENGEYEYLERSES